MSTEQTDRVSGEVIDPSAQTAIVNRMDRAEVDVQITTAKRYPRNIKQFKLDALALATLDEETAAGCFYAMPRDGKNIEGPSARLAEIVVSAWGNIRADARVVEVGEKEVTAEGLCWDLEKNVAVRVQVRRRITKKSGQRFSDDMIVVTGNAACSIALRNAVFKVIPMAMTKSIYEAARQVAIGDAKTLVSKRTDMLAYFAKMGVPAEKVCAAVSKPGVDDIGLDDLATLKGLATAIKDGDTTIDEAFPSPAPAPTPGKGSFGFKPKPEEKKQEPAPEAQVEREVAQTKAEVTAEQQAAAIDPPSTEGLPEEVVGLILHWQGKRKGCTRDQAIAGVAGWAKTIKGIKSLDAMTPSATSELAALLKSGAIKGPAMEALETTA